MHAIYFLDAEFYVWWSSIQGKGERRRGGSFKNSIWDEFKAKEEGSFATFSQRSFTNQIDKAMSIKQDDKICCFFIYK